MHSFYRIIPAADGLVDVLLTPGETFPVRGKLPEWSDHGVRVFEVKGIAPMDPIWGGSLEEHIRMHYGEWLESAEEIEV